MQKMWFLWQIQEKNMQKSINVWTDLIEKVQMKINIEKKNK